MKPKTPVRTWAWVSKGWGEGSPNSGLLPGDVYSSYQHCLGLLSGSVAPLVCGFGGVACKRLLDAAFILWATADVAVVGVLRDDLILPLHRCKTRNSSRFSSINSKIWSILSFHLTTLSIIKGSFLHLSLVILVIMSNYEELSVLCKKKKYTNRIQWFANPLSIYNWMANQKYSVCRLYLIKASSLISVPATCNMQQAAQEQECCGMLSKHLFGTFHRWAGNLKTAECHDWVYKEPPWTAQASTGKDGARLTTVKNCMPQHALTRNLVISSPAD